MEYIVANNVAKRHRNDELVHMYIGRTETCRFTPRLRQVDLPFAWDFRWWRHGSLQEQVAKAVI